MFHDSSLYFPKCFEGWKLFSKVLFLCVVIVLLIPTHRHNYSYQCLVVFISMFIENMFQFNKFFFSSCSTWGPIQVALNICDVTLQWFYRFLFYVHLYSFHPFLGINHLLCVQLLWSRQQSRSVRKDGSRSETTLHPVYRLRKLPKAHYEPKVWHVIIYWKFD